MATIAVERMRNCNLLRLLPEKHAALRSFRRRQVRLLTNSEFKTQSTCYDARRSVAREPFHGRGKVRVPPLFACRCSCGVAHPLHPKHLEDLYLYN